MPIESARKKVCLLTAIMLGILFLTNPESLIGGTLLVQPDGSSPPRVAKPVPGSPRTEDDKVQDQVDAVWFQKKILPILENHCLECHSHQSGSMEGSLALDSQSGWKLGGDSGPAIVPGQPEKSLLLSAIRHTADLKMPPDDKLADSQIELVKRWITAGAPDPRQLVPTDEKSSNPLDWWSLQPLPSSATTALPNPEKHSAQNGSANPIDLFVQSKLSELKLQQAPEAESRLLVRRAYIALHGMTPTPTQLKQLLNVDSFDHFSRGKLNNRNWEQVIDSLLQSPRYGERWARHWLDTVHFADTHGCEHDVIRPQAWPYRDYVIKSFNEDKPWARFVKEQLAVDHFYPERDDLIPALGFISAGPLELSRAGTAPVTFDYLDRDDIVSQTMAALVSTTANCARCHDHKFDPISQQDYYSLQAVFAGGGKGNRKYDPDPDVKSKRSRLEQWLTRIREKDRSLLAAPNAIEWVKRFESQASKRAVWIPLDIDKAISEEGAELAKLDDGTFLARGEKPQTDTYTISGTGQGLGSGKNGDQQLKTVTAIRLDVLPHESLPANGPGRCDNGNLHLNEVEVLLTNPDAKTPVRVAIQSATADWNQQGWVIQHAIDGNEKSAWGIYPEVGKPHHAVFRLKTPIQVGPESRLTIRLRQLHGGSHLIGRFQVYVTDSESDSVQVLPETVRGILAKNEPQRTPDEKLDLALFVSELEIARQQSRLPEPKQVYAWSQFYSHAKPLDQPIAPKVVHVLKRGNIDRPGEIAIPGSLAVLEQLPNRFHSSVKRNESFRRAALANWIVHQDNPLFWRSIVNRVWSYHFGRGICDTPNDFGRMGGIPTHPELLDWLAVWFRDEAKGSLKQLHRLILTSETWKQATIQPNRQLAERGKAMDNDNKYYWRMSPRKLDAETLRDSVLQMAGSLDLSMGGPGVEQFSKSQGRQTTPELNYDSFDWNSATGRRRSIYRVVWRGIADPFMESLDFPDLGLLTGKRESSSSPLQALSTFNNDFILHFSNELASKLASQKNGLPQQVELACLTCWLRLPTEQEAQALVQYAEKHKLAALCRVLINSNEFMFVR